MSMLSFWLEGQLLAAYVWRNMLVEFLFWTLAVSSISQDSPAEAMWLEWPLWPNMARTWIRTTTIFWKWIASLSFTQNILFNMNWCGFEHTKPVFTPRKQWFRGVKTRWRWEVSPTWEVSPVPSTFLVMAECRRLFAPKAPTERTPRPCALA